MATYKVIQDIEAEDKLLGPLSLRQFIYALIAVACIYFSFLLITHGAGFLSPIFIFPALFAGFFAFPWSKQQPTEVWALAKIRFFLKPRKRIWNQTGVKELVTITVPKKIERYLTNGLDQTEVQSRLEALANTLDSRGWAVKNVNVNLTTMPSQTTDSDRLVNVSNMPREVPNDDITAADDMLDAANNPVAHQFDTMIATQAQNRRQQIVQQMQQIQTQQQAAAVASNPPVVPQQAPATMPVPVLAPQQPVAAVPPTPAQQTQAPANYWFMNEPAQQAPLDPGQAQFMAPPAITPGVQDDTQIVASPEEEAIAQRAKVDNEKREQQSYGHLKKLVPIEEQPVAAAVAPQPQPAAAKPVTAPPDPAIIKLASNNDLNVATIARQAKKDKQAEADEVIVSLH